MAQATIIGHGIPGIKERSEITLKHLQDNPLKIQ